MTLKTRLAAMMVLVLVAVVAVQFVMAERERRELAAWLAQLSGELDRSTAVFVERVHRMATGRAPEDLENLLAEFRPDSGATQPRSQIHVVVLADSSHGARLPLLPRAGAGGKIVEFVDETVVQCDTIPAPRSGVVWFRNKVTLGGGDSLVERRIQHLGRAIPASGDHDIVVNLPLPGAGRDSAYAVQMRYSYASLADELSRSRRRSVVWLAALLGVGAAAAIAVAGQFTRPIRALETSFARVESGDLDVRVQPRRRDEIGHLTESFNDMVARLRASQRMAERMAQTEHLASIGRLAAGIAHEIRNPLNAILLNLQQLRDRAAGPPAATPEFDKYHQRIVGEIERLERMVGSFLDLAKAGELRAQPVDLVVGLRAAVDLFRPLAQDRGVHLDLVAAANLPAHADPTRLPAVWNNLLANAIEATPRGGRVTLRAQVDADAVRVTVEDDGRGIAPELQAQVWEPFHSGRDGGTGLGLAIVRSTVESHGGRVDLDSRPGGGTRVHVHLPLVPRPAPEAT
jgi:signal transduction histidine kinase